MTENYYQQISVAVTRRRPWGPAPDPQMSERFRSEPLRPVEPARGFLEAWLAKSFETHRPSFDELFDRFWSNFEPYGRPKAEELESLTVEVVIHPDNARFGGQVRVWIPARATCSTCGGHGLVGPYECWQCEGHGALTREYPITVEYPPGIRDGYAIRIPLSRFGIENFYLTVLLRVGGTWESLA
ncbi:MAG: hypothetical protein ACLQU3_05485 [Limisphaerales bacterium]